jgi:DNA-binding winged helix-turn-helix (wHTH) protein/TolB-like protein
MKSDSRVAFGEFVLDSSSRELFRGGVLVSLQRQPMKVLLLLVARVGEVVTRKELQDAVWDEGTFVDFDQGLNWCVRRLREVLHDDATNPRFIQTLPRHGYRFVASSIVTPRTTRAHFAIASAVVVALVCSLTAAHVLSARPASVTICILPFDNLSGDAAIEPLADLTTEEVINRVGSADPERIKVIDRLTAMKFKRTNECIIHIGEQLGATYVMEGSVQRNGRTTAALYRVKNNTQVWATAAQSSRAFETISDKITATFRHASGFHLD